MILLIGMKENWVTVIISIGDFHIFSMLRHIFFLEKCTQKSPCVLALKSQVVARTYEIEAITNPSNKSADIIHTTYPISI